MESRNQPGHTKTLSSNLQKILAPQKSSNKSLTLFVTPTKIQNPQSIPLQVHARRKSDNLVKPPGFTNSRLYQKLVGTKPTTTLNPTSKNKSATSATTSKTQKLKYTIQRADKENAERVGMTQIKNQFRENSNPLKPGLAEKITPNYGAQVKNFFQILKPTFQTRPRHTKFKSFAPSGTNIADNSSDFEANDQKPSQLAFRQQDMRSESKSNNSHISDNMKTYELRKEQFKRTRKRNLSIPASSTSPFSLRLRKIDSSNRMGLAFTGETSPSPVAPNTATPKIYRNFSNFASGSKSRLSKYSNSNQKEKNGSRGQEDALSDVSQTEKKPDFEMMGNYFVEAKSKIQQNLLKTQASSSRQKISPQMRAILINWMGEVAEHFFMKRITLHLAVAYLDRYLFVIRVDANKSDFQLFGITCLFLASKFEETSVQPVEDFLALAKNIYTKEQLFKLEKDLVVKVNFRLWPKTLGFYLNEYTKVWDEFLISYKKDRFEDKQRLLFRLPEKEQFSCVFGVNNPAHTKLSVIHLS